MLELVVWVPAGPEPDPLEVGSHVGVLGSVVVDDPLDVGVLEQVVELVDEHVVDPDVGSVVVEPVAVVVESHVGVDWLG